MGKFLDALADELKLYVKHSAWLNAAPDVHEAERKAGITKNPSRLESLKNIWVKAKRGRIPEDFVPDMPELLSGGQFIVEFLYEIGPGIANGMGLSSFDHTHIQAWQHNRGIELDSWQAMILQELSREYVGEFHRATSRTAMPPWKECGLGPIITDTRAAVRALLEV